MKGRNSQLMRIFKILTLLETHRFGLSVAEITAKLDERGLEVSKRTVYRDLEGLRASGFPLAEKGKTGDQGTKWILETGSQLAHQLTLTLPELWSLYFARHALKNLENTPVYKNLDTTFNKIKDKLGTSAQAFLDDLGSEIKFETGPKLSQGISGEIIDTIKAGCGERQMLRIEYASAHSQTKKIRKVGPQFIYFSKGTFYLVARDPHAQQNKIFSLSRVYSAELLDEPFEGEQIDPAEYYAHSFGVFRGEQAECVRIQFAKKIAPFIKERIWHKSQRVEEQEDGGIILEMQIAPTPELTQWILSYASDCKVLEPESLKNEIMTRSREIYETYRKKVA